MAIAATTDNLSASRRRPSLILLAIAGWALFAALVCVHLFLHPGDFFLSSDDTMRLAQMRDLIAGQPWFDTTQLRMNAPFGLTMHWPHYVDAAIAVLALLLRPLFGGHSEMAALWLWPVLTALPVFLATTRLGARLAGFEGGILALVLTATSFAVLGNFAPGHIDHHNVQLALCLWMAVCLTEVERPWFFAAAAPLGAFSLAIGLETLPYVLTGSLVAVWFLTIGEPQLDSAVRRFGLLFAGSAAVLFVIAPVSERIAASCDAYSAFYAPLAVAGGIGLSALTLLSQNRGLRIGGALALASALLVMAFLVNPQCLGGPYTQVDPALQTLWLSRIEEAQPSWSFAFQEPAVFFAGYFYAVVCLMASLALCVLSNPSRRVVITLTSLGAAALAVATLEIRGVTFAILLALPGLAGLVVFCLRHMEASKLSKPVQLGLAIVLLFGASDITYGQIGKLAAGAIAQPEASAIRDRGAIACLQPSVLSQLDGYAKGTVAAFVDQGPRILAYSSDATIAGPYHRNARGIIDTNTIFAGTIAQSGAILKARNVGYVLTCMSSPDYSFYMSENRNGLLSQLDRGNVPRWLQPVALHDPQNVLRLYRVVR